MPVDADLTKEFQVGVVLGKGSYGTVYAAVHRRSGAQVAIKVMARERLGSKGESNVKNEIRVMSLLDHPKILHMHKSLYTKENISIVMDKVSGGELLKRLLKLQHYSEKTAAMIMRNLLKGIAYMHEEGVVHRDLKPDNMLLCEAPSSNPGAAEVSDIKIADYGFATEYRGAVLTQPCGTPYYIAPEILHVGVFKTRTSYGHHVDMWSAGVIAYILMSGRPPYDAKDKQKLFQAIARGGHDFSHSVWNGISVEGKDFIKRVLQTDPLKRLTAEEALRHIWITKLDAKPDDKKNSCLPDVHLSQSLAELEAFDSREKIKGAVYGVEAALRMMYLGNCKKNKVHPNTALLEQLTSTTKPVHEISLANNYVGPKGLDQLIKVLSYHSEVSKVNLSNSLIDDVLLEKLCFHLASPTCKVQHLVLDDNPITHAGGRQILAMLYRNEKIRRISVERTHISDSIKKKILKLLERLPTLPAQHHRAERKQAAGAATRTRPASGSRVVNTQSTVVARKSVVPQLPEIRGTKSAPSGDQRNHHIPQSGAHALHHGGRVPQPPQREGTKVPMSIAERRTAGLGGQNNRLPAAASVFFGKPKTTTKQF